MTDRTAAIKQEAMSQAGGILGLIEREMSLVDVEFTRQASSNISIVDHLGEYIRSSGGKRIRPALMILSTYAAGGEGGREGVIRMATVMEMLHTATLVHDDIIDNADTRRGRASVNARFGNQLAVLMGDWLYMSAFETSLGERSLRILDILTRLTRKMTEGELIQLTVIGNADISEDAYFDILRRKTAYLFSGCCEIGAIMAGASDETVSAMREFGMDLGIAFQLADDLLDVTSEDDTIGKSAGSDLLEGKLTLPFIRLIQKQPASRAELDRVMNDGSYESISRGELVRRLYSGGIIEQLQSEADSYLARARKSLEVLPETEYRSALEAILVFVVQRNS